MIFVWYLCAGLIGASNMVLWGVYGDLLAERFSMGKVLRSLVAGLFSGAFLFFLNPNLPLFVVALSAISLERAFTEIYKACIRVEGQDKYRIPSDLGLGGSIFFRRATGVLLAIVLLGLVYFIDFQAPRIATILIAGLVVAAGGALKDAPYEGFNALKLFRSPALAFLVGVFVIGSYPYIDGMVLFLSVIGGERVLSELYKKVLRGRAPGKFKLPLPATDWERKRKRMLPLYILSLLAIAALYFA